MKNQDTFKTSPMEKQILGEENVELGQQTNQKQVAKPKISPKFSLSPLLLRLKTLKKPKVGLLVLAIGAIVILFLGFLGLSKRPQKEQKTVVKITIASPVPSLDPEHEQARKEVTIFNNDLDSLDLELNNIKFPQIDLDINF